MTFSNDQIIAEMKQTGIVPLFTHDDAGLAQQILEAAYAGGIRTFEFTNRKSNSLEVFAHLIRERHRYPELMLGIGTIMDAVTTQKFIDAGADFIISPVVKIEMAKVCHANKKPWIPGCATLTEIIVGKDNGAAVIKIFPGSVVGPSFVSSIMPVVPDLKLMITGGVEPTEQNLSAWFKAGAMCVGLGSQLFTKEIIDQRKWDVLKTKIEESIALVKSIRTKL